jgi:hypothetical protein
LIDKNHIALFDGWRSDSHVLRKTAIESDAKSFVIRTKIVETSPALPAVTTADIGRDENPIASAIAANFDAHSFESSDNLMPRDAYRSGAKFPMAPLDNPQVGCANAGVFDPQQHFVGCDRRNLSLFDPQV